MPRASKSTSVAETATARRRKIVESPAEDNGDLFCYALQRSGNLNDAAYDQMREALMDGRFIPGQAFTIRALAAAFGTSPMPVRDALKRLLAERALEMRRNRSVMLPLMTRQRFQEIVQVRLAIEPMLASRAALVVTPDVLESMAIDHEAMRQSMSAGDIQTFLVRNRSFHFQLYRAANTVMLMPLVESLWTQIGAHLRQVLNARVPQIMQIEQHHHDLLRSLRRQDAKGAADAIWEDISGAADIILASKGFAD